jgi:hypothetical protein
MKQLHCSVTRQRGGKNKAEQRFRIDTHPNAIGRAWTWARSERGLTIPETIVFCNHVAERKKQAELFSLRNHFCIM